MNFWFVEMEISVLSETKPKGFEEINRKTVIRHLKKAYTLTAKLAFISKNDAAFCIWSLKSARFHNNLVYCSW